jgi:hypothetical protein
VISEAESAVLLEVVHSLSLPSVGRLVKTSGGVYENFVEDQIQWVVTFDDDGELVDLKLAKHGFACTNQGCWRSILDLLRRCVGLPSILNYPVYFLEPGLFGPLRKGGWPALRDEAARVRSKVREWAEGMGLSCDTFRLQRVKTNTWVALKANLWEVVIELPDMTVRYNPEINPGARLWGLG